MFLLLFLHYIQYMIKIICFFPFIILNNIFYFRIFIQIIILVIKTDFYTNQDFQMLNILNFMLILYHQYHKLVI